MARPAKVTWQVAPEAIISGSMSRVASEKSVVGELRPSTGTFWPALALPTGLYQRQDRTRLA